MIKGCLFKLQVDLGLLHLTLEQVEDALSLVKGDLGLRKDHAVLRHQFGLLRVQPIQVVQNGVAPDREGAGVGHVGEGRVLGVHRLGLSLRRRGGERRVRTPHALED